MLLNFYGIKPKGMAMLRPIILTLAISTLFPYTQNVLAFNLPVESPESHGLSGVQLKKSDDFARTHFKRIYSLIVLRDGAKVWESYFNGYPEEKNYPKDRAVNVRSVAKSILAILTGMVQESVGPDQFQMTDPLYKYLPDFYPGQDPFEERRKKLTLHQLLTMTTGLRKLTMFDNLSENQNHALFFNTYNLLKTCLLQPFELDGRTFSYSLGNSHLMAAILEKTLLKTKGIGLIEFSKRNLFEPLGITLDAWYRDPQGFPIGGSEMFLTPDALARIGQLSLDGGVWQNQKIVSDKWIQTMLTHHVDAGGGSGSAIVKGYGYFWRKFEMLGKEVWVALGFGGQYIFLSKELKMVVVVTSASDWNPLEYLSNVQKFVSEQIFSTNESPALLSKRNRK